jgi:hypothetical protein
MTPLNCSRRSFLRTSVALAGTTSFIGGSLSAGSDEAGRPLVAYVGTFSSLFRDVLPTQVDLPPGNGRGIHLFRVDRATGALTPAGIHEMGTSPSHLASNTPGNRLYSANETDRVGGDKQGTVGAFAVDRADERLTLLNTVRSGGTGPTYVRSIHRGGTFWLPTISAAPWRRCRSCQTVAWATPRTTRWIRQERPHQGYRRPAGQLRLQRPRSDPRADDPGRCRGAVRPPCRPGAG